MASADAKLATELGVSPAVIAALRIEHLTTPAHWQLDGHTLSYTAEGIELLCTLLGGKKKEGGAAAPRPALRAVPLIIARVYPSRIWVAVRTPTGSHTDVQVKDNVRLRERTQLMCVEIDGKWHCAASPQAKPEILALLQEPKTAPGNGTRPNNKPHRPRP